MQKSVFIFLWSILLFAGYFLYFSPESLHQLDKKKQIIGDLTADNQRLQTKILSYQESEFILEEQDFFVDMGYFEKNQVIVDIKLPILPFNPTEKLSYGDPNTNIVINNKNLSPILFFFFLSVFIIIFFIFYYQRKT